MTDDYYKVLGVEKSATKDEIKKAYKKLARQLHPDNKDTGNAEKFKKINEAAAVLSDDAKRQHYDQYGTADSAAGQGFNNYDFSNFEQSFGGNFDDIFDHLGDFFGGSFRSGRGGRRRRHRGEDLLYELEITLEEAAFGAQKSISFMHIESCSSCEGTGAESGSSRHSCPECNGHGHVRRTQRTPFGLVQTTGVCAKCRGEGQIIEKECNTCDGTGVTRQKKKLDIKIPPGIDDEMKLRVEGQGNAAPHGGDRGDLYVQIHVTEHKHFVREGADIYLDYPISVSQAALGCEIEVPTLEKLGNGKATLRIPAGTQPDTMFRMKRHGIVSIHGDEKGDQMVRVKVKIPTTLSKHEKKLYEELLDESKKSGFFKNLFS